jgi:predicted nuclease of predicted toxin-antitoxin system
VIKLLLDENISPQVAVRLRREGVDAAAVRERGVIGATDGKVLEKAYKEDRVLVTKNVCDFVVLARSSELHAGVVLLQDGGLNREQQLSVIRSALEVMKRAGDMVNCVLYIEADGSMRIEDLPKA